MKELWCDVETTGLSPHKNFVHQIAIMIVIDGEIKEKIDFKVKPPRGTIINSKALEIGGITKADLETYPEHTEVYKAFVATLGKYVDKFDKKDKFTMHGYNVHFDVGFMRAFFTANGDNYYGSWIWSNNIDVMVVAGKHLKEERHLMANFKLGTVYEYMRLTGITEWHDGMADIQATREIYLKCDDEHK